MVCPVTLWYDSQFVQNSAQAAEALKREVSRANFNVCDIRQLRVVRDNSQACSTEQPLYWRVDFLKICILLHALAQDSQTHSIFSDFSVPIMPFQEVFDVDRRKHLEEVGSFSVVELKGAA